MRRPNGARGRVRGRRRRPGRAILAFRPRSSARSRRSFDGRGGRDGHDGRQQVGAVERARRDRCSWCSSLVSGFLPGSPPKPTRLGGEDRRLHHRQGRRAPVGRLPRRPRGARAVLVARARCGGSSAAPKAASPGSTVVAIARRVFAAVMSAIGGVMLGVHAASSASAGSATDRRAHLLPAVVRPRQRHRVRHRGVRRRVLDRRHPQRRAPEGHRAGSAS